MFINTCFFLLFVEVIDNHTNKQVKSKKRTKNNKKHKIKVHVIIDFTNWLFSVRLKKKIIIMIVTFLISDRINKYN